MHSATCPNVVNLLYDPERRIDVEWDKSDAAASNYTVKLTMEVEDRKGLLAAVSARIADINTNIKNMEAHTDEDRRGADRRDRRDQRSQAPGEGDQIASRRRRRAGRRDGAGGVGRRVEAGAGRPGRSRPALDRLVYVHGDGVDFDARVARQPGGLDGGPGRIRLGEERAVDLVHGLEVVHVGEEHRRADDVRVGEARRRRAARRYSPARAASARAMSPSTIVPVAGSIGTCPDTNRSCPARSAAEYGPIGLRRVGTRRSPS